MGQWISMNQWINEPSNQWIDEWAISESMNEWFGETMNQWICQPLIQWMSEWMKRWINEPMTQWINESTNHWWFSEPMIQGINEFNEPMRQWITEPVNQGISDSMKQRSNESMNHWSSESMNQWTNGSSMIQWTTEPMNQRCANAFCKRRLQTRIAGASHQIDQRWRNTDPTSATPGATCPKKHRVSRRKVFLNSHAPGLLHLPTTWWWANLTVVRNSCNSEIFQVSKFPLIFPSLPHRSYGFWLGRMVWFVMEASSTAKDKVARIYLLSKATCLLLSPLLLLSCCFFLNFYIVATGIIFLF